MNNAPARRAHPQPPEARASASLERRGAGASGLCPARMEPRKERAKVTPYVTYTPLNQKGEE